MQILPGFDKCSLGYIPGLISIAYYPENRIIHSKLMMVNQFIKSVGFPIQTLVYQCTTVMIIHTKPFITVASLVPQKV